MKYKIETRGDLDGSPLFLKLYPFRTPAGSVNLEIDVLLSFRAAPNGRVSAWVDPTSPVHPVNRLSAKEAVLFGRAVLKAGKLGEALENMRACDDPEGELRVALGLSEEAVSELTKEEEEFYRAEKDSEARAEMVKSAAERAKRAADKKAAEDRTAELEAAAEKEAEEALLAAGAVAGPGGDYELPNREGSVRLRWNRPAGSKWTYTRAHGPRDLRLELRTGFGRGVRMSVEGFRKRFGKTSGKAPEKA